MIARVLLLLCAVAMAQAFLAPQPIQPLVRVPIMKPMVRTKIVPIVKYIRQPVYIERIVRVPHYIERAIPVPYGGGSAGAAGATAGGASSLDFGLNAQIEDADTVNIVAGVSGASGFSGNNNNNDEFNNNGFGGVIGGGLSGGIHRQSQPSISVSQTSIAQPSAHISQPQFGHGGHGQQKMPSHFGHF